MNKISKPWLTTKDNPYNPFTQFDQWYAFDEQKGYHTLEYLARVTITSPELTVDQQEDDITDAINEIMRYNLTGNYIVVYDSD